MRVGTVELIRSKAWSGVTVAPGRNWGFDATKNVTRMAVRVGIGVGDWCESSIALPPPSPPSVGDTATRREPLKLLPSTKIPRSLESVMVSAHPDLPCCRI